MSDSRVLTIIEPGLGCITWLCTMWRFCLRSNTWSIEVLTAFYRIKGTKVRRYRPFLKSLQITETDATYQHINLGEWELTEADTRCWRILDIRSHRLKSAWYWFDWWGPRNALQFPHKAEQADKPGPLAPPGLDIFMKWSRVDFFLPTAALQCYETLAVNQPHISIFNRKKLWIAYWNVQFIEPQTDINITLPEPPDHWVLSSLKKKSCKGFRVQSSDWCFYHY